MRVIVVNDYGCINGGASQVAISSVNALSNIGCDLTFVYAVGPLDKSINTDKARVLDFNFQDLLGYRSKYRAAINGIWNFQASKKFSLLLNDYETTNTIIHFHSWTKSLTSSVMRLAIDRGFKVVVTLHDYFSCCPNGGLYHFNDQKHCYIQPLSLKCALTDCDARSYAQKNWRFVRAYVQKYLGLIPSGVKNFITISDYSEKLLHPLIGSNSNYYRIKNPIEVNQNRVFKAGNSKKFTFVGRLSPEKGASIFAEATKLAGVDGVCVGDGPLMQQLQFMNENLKFTGWVGRNDVQKYILESRAVVFPSLWHETQGLVVSEAAALGIPSIVSNSCAARDFVSDGETGLLFQHANVVSLAAAIKFLAENEDIAMSLGRNAHNAYWSAPSTLNKHATELLNVYQIILKKV